MISDGQRIILFITSDFSMKSGKEFNNQPPVGTSDFSMKSGQEFNNQPPVGTSDFSMKSGQEFNNQPRCTIEVITSDFRGRRGAKSSYCLDY